MGLIITLELSSHVLECSLVDKSNLPAPSGRSLTVVCVSGSNSSILVSLGFLGSLEGVLDSSLTGDFVVLLGDSTTHMGNSNETWLDGCGWRELPTQSEPMGFWNSAVVIICPLARVAISAYGTMKP